MSAFGNAYSKWDHLEDSDDDNEAANEAAVAAEAANEAAAAEAAAAQAYAEAAYAADDKGGGGGGGDGAVRSSSSAAAANAAGGGGAEEEEETIATLPGMAKVDPATAAQMAAEDPEAARMLAEAGMTSVGKVTSKGSEAGRFRFEHNGQLVYEWDQSLDEINLYIAPPPGVTSAHIACTISPTHLSLGIKGNPPFLNENTFGPVIVEDSFWMMDGDELTVNLQKMRKGETWDAALEGRGGTKVDPFTKQEIQKKMMLERFQEENPGFDFSGADFNGMVPDARSFMGGVKYS